MKLYLADRAPNPDRVKYFLREKGLWDEIPREEVSIIAKEHRASSYLQISPQGRVPALVLDDGRALTESRAICTWFEGRHPEPNLMGRDADERAFIEMWDRRVEMTLFLQVAAWFRNSHPAMAELESPQCAEWAVINSGRALESAIFFDRRLAEAPFVAGDRFTIADITLYVTLGFGRLVRFRPWEDLPALGAWRERMMARPALA